MTRAFDTKQLIAEQAASPAERRGLEEIAERLEESLGADVPYRPEFKAQLRRKLMHSARQQLTPWYRRPAFLGSGLAVAAAAAVLVVGLNLQLGPGTQEVDPRPQVASPETPPVTEPKPTVVTLVSELRNVPVVPLADERLAAADSPSFTGAADISQGLPLRRLTARPDAEQFRTMASQLAFRGESRRTANGWVATEESRTLAMTDDGQVGYQESAPAAPAAGRTISAEEARQLAQRFLDRALLPIPGQPAITAEPGGFTLVYTEQVDEHPVVNARTVIRLNAGGTVVNVQAYVASGTEVAGRFAAVSQAEAIAEARAKGGTFDRADLVWVRTAGEGTVYLQPYWRVYGIDGQGTPILRYVPALKR